MWLAVITFLVCWFEEENKGEKKQKTAERKDHHITQDDEEKRSVEKRGFGIKIGEAMSVT